MHTRSPQESNFIMETFYLLLLLNNPQLGLLSPSPHLFHICSEEIKKPLLEGGEEGSYLLAHSLTQHTKKPWLCLHFTFITGWFFFQTSHVNSLTSLFHLTHLEICVTGDVSALSNLPPLFCSYPWGGREVCMWVFAEQHCLLRGSIFIHLTSEWAQTCRSCQEQAVTPPCST